MAERSPEKEEKPPKLPSKEEIMEKAIELYYKEHPEAWEHRLTPEEVELRAAEGGYLTKAQAELMADVSKYKEELYNALLAYREEVEGIAEELQRLGEKPEWPPPPPEELIQKQTKLVNKISALESKIEKIAHEKKVMEEKLKALQKTLAEKEAELTRKREIEKRYIYKMVTVKFLAPQAAFTGADGKTYGPCATGEVASLPEQDAETLIKLGVAQPWAVTPAKIEKPPTKIPDEIREKIDKLWGLVESAVKQGEAEAAIPYFHELREIRRRYISPK